MPEIRSEIVHTVVKKPFIAKMSCKPITGKKHMVFFYIRKHGIRPVPVWRMDKLQLLIAQTDTLTILNGLSFKINVKHIFQKNRSRFCGKDLDMGIFFQYTAQCPRMIHFCMIDNNILNIPEVY